MNAVVRNGSSSRQFNNSPDQPFQAQYAANPEHHPLVIPERHRFGRQRDRFSPVGQSLDERFLAAAPQCPLQPEVVLPAGLFRQLAESRNAMHLPKIGIWQEYRREVDNIFENVRLLVRT